MPGASRATQLCWGEPGAEGGSVLITPCSACVAGDICINKGRQAEGTKE